MRGLGARIRTNLIALVLFSIAVIMASFLRFATSGGFEEPYNVRVQLPEAGGVLPGQEVTVLGRAVGQVSDVTLVPSGVEIELEIPRQFDVPASATVQVLRRSPIGEQAVDLRPDGPDWVPAEPGAEIEATEKIVPAEVPFLLDRTVALFSAIDTDDLSTVIHELALALEGRGETLVQLNRDSLDLNRTLVDGIPTLERLTAADTVEVLDTLRDSASDLGETFDNAAALAELLAEEQPTLERLLETSPVALSETQVLIEEQSANVECLLDDLTSFNQMVNGPSTWGTSTPSVTDPDRYASKLDEFESALQLHQFFFQQGFSILAQPDPDTGIYWQRIDLQLAQSPGGQRYDELRETPVTRPGAACVSDVFGLGVNAVRQADVTPPNETLPDQNGDGQITTADIDWAPLVAGERAQGRPVAAPDLGTVGPDGDLAATGGGVLLAAPLLVGLALVLRRRR